MNEPSMNRFHESPDQSIRDNAAPVQRVDHHDHGNKALAIVALVAACFALGMVSMYVITAAQLIDAKIAKGNAEVTASLQQQIAHAQETAQAAKEHARVALDKVEQTQVQLGAKGLIQPSTH